MIQVIMDEYRHPYLYVGEVSVLNLINYSDLTRERFIRSVTDCLTEAGWAAHNAWLLTTQFQRPDTQIRQYSEFLLEYAEAIATEAAVLMPYWT